MTLSSLFRCGLALLLGALSLPVSAQFNGPGPLTAGQLNQPAPVTSNQALLRPAPRDVHLAQGDVITISIFGQEQFSPPLSIGTDGNVLLPLIGIVSLDHLTITAAEELIAARLEAAGMYKDPQVTIQVTDGPNATATIIGETHGVVPVIGSRRLLDVLAAAGGLPSTASHVITIDRPGLPEPLIVNLGTDPARSALADVPIFPGDTIVVARIGLIYLIGAFKSQGTIPLSSNTPLTLLEVTALTGGPTFAGKTSDLRLIRTIGDRRIVIKLDLKKVMYGRAPDPLLQANDILFLPNSILKSAISNGSIGTVLGIVSVALSSIAYLR